MSTQYRQAVRRAAGGRGFTLIELLVVVSIIALLLAILLPSLARAREQGNRTKCMTNLKGIATAAATYASDEARSGEQIIPIHPDAFVSTLHFLNTRYLYGGKGGKADANGRVDCKRGVFGSNSEYRSPHRYGPESRPLNPIIYPTRVKKPDNVSNEEWACRTSEFKYDIFKCPSDKGYVGGFLYGSPAWGEKWDKSRLSGYDFFGTSYAANTLWIYEIGRTRLYSLSPALRKVSTISNTSRMILFWELAGRDAWRAKKWDEFGNPEQQENDWNREFGSGRAKQFRVARGWHKTDWTFTMSFVDGHADFLKMHGYRNEVVDETKYPLSGWWRVIIRDPAGRWQLDSLPAPPIDTGMDLGSGRDARQR